MEIITYGYPETQGGVVDLIIKDWITDKLLTNFHLRFEKQMIIYDYVDPFKKQQYLQLRFCLEILNGISESDGNCLTIGNQLWNHKDKQIILQNKNESSNWAIELFNLFIDVPRHVNIVHNIQWSQLNDQMPWENYFNWFRLTSNLVLTKNTVNYYFVILENSVKKLLYQLERLGKHQQKKWSYLILSENDLCKLLLNAPSDEDYYNIVTFKNYTQLFNDCSVNYTYTRHTPPIELISPQRNATYNYIIAQHYDEQVFRHNFGNRDCNPIGKPFVFPDSFTPGFLMYQFIYSWGVFLPSFVSLDCFKRVAYVESNHDFHLPCSKLTSLYLNNSCPDYQANCLDHLQTIDHDNDPKRCLKWEDNVAQLLTKYSDYQTRWYSEYVWNVIFCITITLSILMIHKICVYTGSYISRQNNFYLHSNDKLLRSNLLNLKVDYLKELRGRDKSIYFKLKKKRILKKHLVEHIFREIKNKNEVNFIIESLKTRVC